MGFGRPRFLILSASTVDNLLAICYLRISNHHLVLLLDRINSDYINHKPYKLQNSIDINCGNQSYSDKTIFRCLYVFSKYEILTLHNGLL